MFNNLKTLIIDGKTVATLSINGVIVWKSIPSIVLLTADNMPFMTANGKYFGTKAEENNQW